MQAKKLLLGVVMAASLGVVLTGCGSSGTTTPRVEPTSPLDTASQSVSNFIAYIQGLASSDSIDPVVIDTLTAPSDEAAEPITVSS